MGMNVSNTLADTFQLKASTAIAIKDAVGIGPDGRGYPISVTDYAAVTNCTYGTAQTSTATGRIITETSLGSVTAASCGNKKSMVQASDGCLLIAYPISGNYNGLKVSRFSANGGLLGSTELFPAAGGALNEPEIILLSSGNYAVLGQTSGNLYYAIITSSLAIIKSATLISGGIHTDAAQYDAVALSGGGFAVAYNYTTTPEHKLITYDNAGTVVLSATTIKAWSGAGTFCTTQMHQLSSGNLAIVCGSGYAGSLGTWHGVFQPDGTPVLAFANLQGVSPGGSSLASMPGYYAVFSSNGTNAMAWVFSNSGILQGAPYSSANSFGMTLFKSRVLAGNTEFFALYPQTSVTALRVLRIPITGTGYTVVDVTVSGGDPYNKGTDAFIDGDFINVFSSGTQPFLWRYSTVTNSVATPSITLFGTSIVQAADISVCIPLGDSAFAHLRDASGATYFVAGKYANTSIVGVAASSAAANDYANIHQAAGTYPVNTLKGSPAVAFDHTTGATINGNKGTILTNGLVLRGM